MEINYCYSNEKVNSFSTSFESKLFSFVLVFMIVGNVYVVPGLSFISFGEFAMILFMPYFLIKSYNNHKHDKSLTLVYMFMIYSFFITISMCFSYSLGISDAMIRMIRELFFYIIIFFVGRNLFDYKIFKKYFSSLVIVLALFVILQGIVYYWFGYFIPGLLMNATLNDGGVTGAEMYNNLLNYAKHSGYIKINGFLAEPSHCAHLFFLCFIMNIFDKNVKKRLFINSILIFSIILCMSTTGYICLIIALLTWVFYGKGKIIHKALLILLLGLLAIILFSSNFSTSLTDVLSRFTDVFEEKDYYYSGDVRIKKGFEFYDILPNINKLFGIGFGNYERFCNSGVIAYQEQFENEYMNSIAYILCSSGLIGFVLYCSYFVYMFKKTSKLGKIIIISMFILFFGSSFYCTTLYVIMLLIIMQNRNEVEI